jgi:copper chaperone CopZ
MEKMLLNVPAMYADHHATAVRRLLEALPGVEDIYTSPAARQVQVSYDPEVMAEEDIKAALSAEGYGEDMLDPAGSLRPKEDPRRHTAAHAAAEESSPIPDPTPNWEGRPLWPCPGLEYKTAQTPEE